MEPVGFASREYVDIYCEAGSFVSAHNVLYCPANIIAAKPGKILKTRTWVKWSYPSEAKEQGIVAVMIRAKDWKANQPKLRLSAVDKADKNDGWKKFRVTPYKKEADAPALKKVKTEHKEDETSQVIANKQDSQFSALCQRVEKLEAIVERLSRELDEERKKNAQPQGWVPPFDFDLPDDLGF